MFLGLFAIIFKGCIVHGGFGNIWQIMKEGDRIEFFNTDPDPRARYTIWSLSVGGAFSFLSIYAVNQVQVQRALCTPTLRTGQRQVAWFGYELLFIVILIRM
ncbi:Sodium-dependent multivitamin transporter [Lamellibrachia satsuma]|nr:Sodium-dependent multivitamin transporter [Lamellibrachia satsuma]